MSASNRVGARLAARRYLQTLPHVGNADWIVLDTTDLWLPDARLPVLAERSPAALARLRNASSPTPGGGESSPAMACSCFGGRDQVRRATTVISSSR